MQEFLTQALMMKKQYKEILPKAERKNLFTVYQSVLKEKQTPSQNLRNHFPRYSI